MESRTEESPAPMVIPERIPADTSANADSVWASSRPMEAAVLQDT